MSDNVLLEIRSAEELSAAHVAFKLLRRLVFVSGLVLSQITRRSEFRSTGTADEILVLGMRQHVIPEACLMYVVLVALRALEISYVEVDPLLENYYLIRSLSDR